MSLVKYFLRKLKNSNFIIVAIFIIPQNFSIGFPLLKSKIKKANEALVIYDYFKAKKFYYKALKKNKCEANLGLAIIYYRPDNPFYNIDSAFVHIQNTKLCLEKLLLKNKEGNGSNLNNDTKKISNKQKKNFFELNKKRKSCYQYFCFIDSVLYSKATQMNTVESFKKYISYYDKTNDKSSNFSKAKLQVGNIIFNDAFMEKKAKSILELSKNCDSQFCAFSSEIKSRIPSILLELQFNEMAEKKSVQEYSKFRAEHPQSVFDIAIDDSIFLLSTSSKSEKSYYEFIKQNQQNRNVSKAWHLIYNNASNDNSPNFFKHFLEKYPEYPYIENVAKEYKLSQSNFYKIRRNKLYGFCDANGSELIKPNYEFLDEFSEGFCVATLNEKSGFIGRNGSVLIPFIYDEAERFVNNLAIVKRDNTFLVINKRNEILFSSKDEINDFSENLAVVKHKEKFGYLNEKGVFEIQPQFENAYDFKEGFAVVEKNGKVGLIDKLGSIVVPFEYEWIDNFNNEIYRLQTEEKVSLISITQNKKILEDADFIDVLSDGLAAFHKDEKLGYIDSLGNILIVPQFEVTDDSKLLQQFANGFAQVFQKGKIILIDKTGKNILNQNYQSIHKPSENMIAVKRKNKWGYVDISGDLKIKFQFQDAGNFTDGLAIVKLKSKQYIIDTNGNFKLQLKQQKIQFLGNGLLLSETQNHKNLCGIDFSTIITDIDEVKPFKDNFLIIEKNGKMSYFNMSHKKFIWVEDGFVLN